MGQKSGLISLLSIMALQGCAKPASDEPANCPDHPALGTWVDPLDGETISFSSSCKVGSSLCATASDVSNIADDGLMTIVGSSSGGSPLCASTSKYVVQIIIIGDTLNLQIETTGGLYSVDYDRQ